MRYRPYMGRGAGGGGGGGGSRIWLIFYMQLKLCALFSNMVLFWFKRKVRDSVKFSITADPERV